MKFFKNRSDVCDGVLGSEKCFLLGKSFRNAFEVREPSVTFVGPSIKYVTLEGEVLIVREGL